MDTALYSDHNMDELTFVQRVIPLGNTMIVRDAPTRRVGQTTPRRRFLIALQFTVTTIGPYVKCHMFPRDIRDCCNNAIIWVTIVLQAPCVISASLSRLPDVFLCCSGEPLWQFPLRKTFAVVRVGVWHNIIILYCSLKMI